MSTISDGIYSYRFSGFAQDAAQLPNFLVGLGWLQVVGGTVSGQHRSTHVRTSGGPQAPEHWEFAVSGNFSFDAAVRFGSANLQFVQQGVDADDAQTFHGGFAFVPTATQDRYWLISKAGTSVQTGQTSATTAMEVVEGELVRIS